MIATFFVLRRLTVFYQPGSNPTIMGKPRSLFITTLGSNLHFPDLNRWLSLGVVGDVTHDLSGMRTKGGLKGFDRFKRASSRGIRA